MSRLTINDHTVDARDGENVLALARRHGLHVWFLCDGRGLCRTCECRVLEGADQLNPPTRIERGALAGDRLQEGYRLACQAAVRGPGDVALLSTAERLRRQAVRLDLTDLVAELTRFSFDLSASLPEVSVKVLPRLIAMPPNATGVDRYVRDGLRMMTRLLR